MRGLFVALAVSVAAVAMLTAACGQNPVRQAEKMLEEGNVDHAIETLLEYRKAHPDDYGVHKVLGDAYLQQAVDMETDISSVNDRAYQKALENSLNSYQKAQKINYSYNLEMKIGRVSMKASPY